MTKQIEIICEVDTNDADYETAITKITPETLELLTPVFKRIAEIGNTWSWDIDDVKKTLEEEFGEDLIETASEYLMIPEYGESNLETLKVVETETLVVFK